MSRLPPHPDPATHLRNVRILTSVLTAFWALAVAWNAFRGSPLLIHSVFGLVVGLVIRYVLIRAAVADARAERAKE